MLVMVLSFNCWTIPTVLPVTTLIVIVSCAVFESKRIVCPCKLIVTMAYVVPGPNEMVVELVVKMPLSMSVTLALWTFETTNT